MFVGHLPRWPASERRRRSCSTSTPPATRSTASKKVGSHGYYDSYCYLPLYIFCVRFLLGAKLRPANIDGAAGAVERGRPDRPRPHPGPLAEGADRAARRFGLLPRGADGVVRGRGCRLPVRLRPTRESEGGARPRPWEAARLCRPPQGGSAVQGFRLPDRDLLEPTAAGCGQGRAPARRCQSAFVVTGLGREKIDAPPPGYEDLYCADGEMENRIKECQLDLFADRTSSATMQANQLRLWETRRWLTCCSASCAGSRSATPAVCRCHLRHQG